MEDLATVSDSEFLALAQKQVPEGSCLCLFPRIVAWSDLKNKLDGHPSCTTLSSAVRSLRLNTVFIVEGRLDKVWRQGQESNWHCLLVFYHDRQEGKRAITVYDPKPACSPPTYLGNLKPKLVRGLVDAFLKAAPARTNLFWCNGDPAGERPEMGCRRFCVDALANLVACNSFEGSEQPLPRSRPRLSNAK